MSRIGKNTKIINIRNERDDIPIPQKSQTIKTHSRKNR